MIENKIKIPMFLSLLLLSSSSSSLLLLLLLLHVHNPAFHICIVCRFSFLVIYFLYDYSEAQLFVCFFANASLLETLHVIAFYI